MKLPLSRKAHNIDEDYKAVMTGLLCEIYGSAPRKQKVDTNEVYIREQVAADHALVLRHLKEYDRSSCAINQSENSKTSKKRKRKCNIIEQFDDSDIEKSNPQNGILLRHFREDERVYTQRSHCAGERNKLQSLRKLKGDHAHLVKVRKDRTDVAHLEKSYVCEESDGRSKRVKECKLEKGVVKEEVKEENQEIYQHVGKKTDHCVEIRCVNSAEIVKEEVEILDNDMVVKGRILTPFVPDEMHRRILGDESQNHVVFRKEVLKAISKPYDKEEHQNHREMLKDGSYLNYYPGLRKILAKFRYQRVKRLIIIRGFLFYLQNAAREGAFHPWEDEECLAVDILNQEK